MFDDLLINIKVNKDGVRDGINGVSSALKGLKSSMSGLNQIIGMGKLYMMADGLAKCIKSTMDMTETVNLFSVAMGDTSVATNNVLTGLTGVSGLDLTNMQNAVGTFSLLARSMGMTNQQASVLGLNTSQLALDLSSLTNVPIDRVMQDLRSGLLGQSETVYKYGMDVTEAGIKTEAMRQGIDKSVRDMSQGEKMALRYSVMIRQSGLAQGDFAKTIETPANQLRILSERFITLGRSIGSIFMPLIGAMLPYLNAFVSILISLSNSIAKFFGFVQQTPTNSNKSAIGGIGDDLSDATGEANKTTKALKDMKNATMGFDEINVLPKDNPSSGKGAGGVGGGASILPTFEMPSYDSLMSGIHQKSDDIKKAILDAFGKINFTPIKNSFAKLWVALSPVIDNIKTSLIWLWDNVLVPFGKWTISTVLPTFFNDLAKIFTMLNPLMDKIGQGFLNLWDTDLKPLLSIAGDVFIQFLKDSASALVIIGDWMTSHMDTVTAITKLILGFMLAWETTKILGFIGESGGLIQALGRIAIAIGGVTASQIANELETIALIGMYAVDFVESCAKSVLSLGELAGAFVINTIRTGASTIAQIGMTIATGTWTTICAIATGVTSAFGVVIGFLTSPIGLVILAIAGLVAGVVLLWRNWDNVTSWMRTNMSGTYTAISNIIGDVKQVFNGLVDFVAGVFTGNWSRAIGGLRNVITGVFSGIGDILTAPFETLIDGAKKVLNWFKGININKNSTDTNTSFGVNYGTVPKLARGGMVDGGAMFQAGENGKAEMIGSYQGRTTVMPLENTSFVGAMSDAVYNAVKMAMPTSTSSSNESTEIVLKVGSTEFGRVAIDSINKITKQEGRLALNI